MDTLLAGRRERTGGQRWDRDSGVSTRNLGWTSLVVQRLGIRLPVQETRVPSLLWEDPTCLRATKPVRHNLRACEP